MGHEVAHGDGVFVGAAAIAFESGRPGALFFGDRAVEALAGFLVDFGHRCRIERAPGAGPLADDFGGGRLFGAVGRLG